MVFHLLHSTTVQYVQVHVFGYLPLGERSSSAGPRGTLLGISSSWLKQTRIPCLLAGSGTEHHLGWLPGFPREAGSCGRTGMGSETGTTTAVTLVLQQTPCSMKYPAPSHHPAFDRRQPTAILGSHLFIAKPPLLYHGVSPVHGRPDLQV